MQKQFGQLIREIKTVPAQHGAVTEEQAICFFDRSSMFSQYVDANDVADDLALLYAYPADTIDPDTGHLAAGAWDASAAREWVMVYRYYPQTEPERSRAMNALNEWHDKIPSTFGTMGKPNNSEGL
jgi:hypothetical protein